MMKQHDDISRLAHRARKGDGDALACLIDVIRMSLFTRAYAVSNNYADAQDAVANAIVEICRHIGELREPRGIVPWMQRIAHREALRLTRKPSIEALSGDEMDQRDDVLNSIFKIDVERALRTLPVNHANALHLYYLDNLSVREVATEMSSHASEVSAGQVKVWLHRGRQQLADKMKGYADMKSAVNTTTASRRAALICSNLPPGMIATITEAMRMGGFSPDVISDVDLPGFSHSGPRVPSIWTKDHIAQSTALTRILKQYDALVLDEQIGKRSGLEFSMFCKSSADTVRIPITLLHSQPVDAVFIQACATIGLPYLIDKTNIESIAGAFRPARGSDMWQRFRDDARQVIYYCQEEAAHLHENYVSTEHLLLGLIRYSDCPGAKILNTYCGTSLEAVRTELAKHLQYGPGHNEALDMQLTPRCKSVIDLSDGEAKQMGANEVGSEHILLGLIAEQEGLAGRVLETLGVDLNGARLAASQYAAA